MAKFSNMKISKKKRAEGFLGMSFSMIFSIILIIFFIAAGFIGIRAFLGWQQTAQIGLAMRDLQDNINEAWNCGSCSFYFNFSLPNGIEAVCFANLSSLPNDASSFERKVHEYLVMQYHEPKDNLFIYAPSKNFGLSNSHIKHVDLSQHNPICIVANKNKFSVFIEKKSDNPLVFVS